jgi:XTP/dITP diphosphohydrolase
MEELYFVTSNDEKIQEARIILGMPIRAFKADLEEIQSLDLEKIAKDKAERAFALVGKPLFVDDVALRVAAWNGFPGPFVKHFLEALGNDGFLRLMKDEQNRELTAMASIAFHNGKEILTFVGEVKGSLALEPRGDGGWGWDSVFIPVLGEKTYAEMTPEEKNAVSHRRAALENFKQYLNP